ncbi:MAG: (2Fe-2S)-binding protein [Sulfurovum sp.]|nr:(2Fe-2S)-binding protein [Sulfurovum sp.]
MMFTTQKKIYDDVTTLDGDDLICYCIGVDKQTIVEAVLNGANTLKTIKEQTMACTGDACKEKTPTAAAAPKRSSSLSNFMTKETR